MSILLDALKKSETQRQLGTVPTLETPAFNPEPGRQRHYSWVPAAMSLATVALIFWVGLAQFRHTVGGSSQPDSGHEPVPQTVAVKAARKRLAHTEVQPATTPVKDYHESPRSSPGEAASQPSSEAASRPVSRQDLPLKSFSTESPSSAKASPGTDDSAAADDTLEPYVAEPISYWQLPESMRDSLGELHISVLVYSDNPQERFVLINGQRLREQEELGDGLLLLEIQRDRAIFSYRSYRFQLKS